MLLQLSLPADQARPFVLRTLLLQHQVVAFELELAQLLIQYLALLVELRLFLLVLGSQLLQLVFLPGQFFQLKLLLAQLVLVLERVQQFDALGKLSLIFLERSDLLIHVFHEFLPFYVHLPTLCLKKSDQVPVFFSQMSLCEFVAPFSELSLNFFVIVCQLDSLV